MKAAVLHANKDIRYEDWSDPVTKPGAIKVRVRAAGVCGSDIPRVLANGCHFYPIVLGHEFAGVVAEIGEGVTGFEPGDRVAGAPLLPCMRCEDCQRGDFSLCRHYSFIGSREQGGFAEYVVLPARNAVKFDSSVPFELGAMFEPSTVALHGLYCNDFRGGGDTAILGAGAIGIFTMQWARIMGAKRVVVFDIDDDRLALAARLGADVAVNTLRDGFMEEARAATGGQGFDYVFETAGNPATMRMAFDAAGGKARVCFIGTATKEIVFSPALMELMNRKEFRLTGSWMSYSAPFPGREWELTARCFADGRLRFDEGFVFRRFPLEQAAEAFALYETPGAVKGKILLTMGE